MTAGARLFPLVALAALAPTIAASGCSSSKTHGAPNDDGGGTGTCYVGCDEGGTSSGGEIDGTANFSSGGGPIFKMCASGTNFMCQQGGGGSGCQTTISGTVYDPAGNNPVYNVAVYVPNQMTGIMLPSGVTQSTCSCSDLYTTPITAYTTGPDGSFNLTNAPSGTNIPLIVQVGKWRKLITIPNVTECKGNPIGKVTLPKNHMEGDLPDIAISTGGADSLECLPYRMGIDPSEYVPGPSTAGRIHIFQGFQGANTNPAAPTAAAALWNSDTSLTPYDVTLLSCEGAPTSGGGSLLTSQNQQYLLDYLNKGGRVFASHFHYAWFTTGPFSMLTTPPLLKWTQNTLNGMSGTIDDGSVYHGKIVGTTASGGMFPEGIALQAWLSNVSALDTNQELPYYYARDNLVSVNAPAQVWLNLDGNQLSSSDAMTLASMSGSSTSPPEYVSFDLPIGTGSETAGCGRVVYSDLHVSGGPGATEPPMNGMNIPADYGSGGGAGVVPTGCAMHTLTPQEKALEFMIFDLSSCLIPIGMMAPPITVQ
jgi:hypothetical protein